MEKVIGGIPKPRIFGYHELHATGVHENIWMGEMKINEWSGWFDRECSYEGVWCDER